MITYILNTLETLRNDENGATAIEYGLIAAGIAVVIIGGIAAAGGALTNTFNSITAAL
jgi:pilus assembly protein Flp/PilA